MRLVLSFISSIYSNHGTIRAIVDVLRVPWPVPHPETATLSAQFLYGALYGGPHRLRAPSGKVSRVPSRAPNSLPRRSSLPHECHAATLLGAAHWDNWRTARSHIWWVQLSVLFIRVIVLISSSPVPPRSNNGTLQCVLGEGLLRRMCALRQEGMDILFIQE